MADMENNATAKAHAKDVARCNRLEARLSRIEFLRARAKAMGNKALLADLDEEANRRQAELGYKKLRANATRKALAE